MHPKPSNTELSDKKLTRKKSKRIEKVDLAVKEYFEQNPAIQSVCARDLMPLFIEKGIFENDYMNAFPIRELLRTMERDNQFHLFNHAKPVRIVKSGREKLWYFERL